MNILSPFHKNQFNRVVATIKPYLHPPLVILLIGPTGVGKTTLLKALFRDQVPPGEIHSPTFLLHHCYQGKQGTLIHHMDFYRLQKPEELDTFGFWEFFSNTESIICIEWGDKFGTDLFPSGWSKLKIKLGYTRHTFLRSLSVKKC